MVLLDAVCNKNAKNRLRLFMQIALHKDHLAFAHGVYLIQGESSLTRECFFERTESKRLAHKPTRVIFEFAISLTQAADYRKIYSET